MTTRTHYIVVPAPGHYGDRTRVLSSHVTAEAALRAARRRGACAVYEDGASKGSEWLRVYEQTSRRVTG